MYICLTDGLVAKDNTVEGEEGFPKVAPQKEPYFGVIWLDDALRPWGGFGMLLVEYLRSSC